MSWIETYGKTLAEGLHLSGAERRLMLDLARRVEEALPPGEEPAGHATRP